jgi:cyclase
MLAVFGPAAAPHAMTGDTAEFVKLADDVYAYVGKKNDANAMAIVTSQGVVIVDTGNNQPDTRDFAAKIKSVTNQPVRYIVVSQNHGDHIGGAPLFAPPATLIVHDKVRKDLAAMKPYQIKAWRKRFPERADALANLAPADLVMGFTDHMTLNLGGKRIELIYVDDPYNIGDVAVYLQDSGIMHGSFAGYKDRHPDIRPDYSHGTTWGMLKQVEAYMALKPKIVVPAHGPIGDIGILENMIDYLLLARQKVRVMMEKGLPLATIVKDFNMNEYAGWDRGSHFEWMAETIYRELRGEGPLVIPIVEKETAGVITKIAEEGRFFTIDTGGGAELRLRVGSDTNIEGIPDRTHFKVGMKLTATYQVQEGFNPALGYDIVEAIARP